MPLPKGFREWLAKESAAWNSDGVIDGVQRDRILARYPEEPTESGALAFALRTLGVLLFGAAIFLVISHNWSDLDRTGQLAIVFAALAVIQGSGVYFFLKGQERNAIIGHLLGCLMYGGGIALIGQIYHLDAHAPDAILAWALFTIPFALLLDATVLHLLVIVLAGVWLNMEAGDRHAWRHTALYGWERAGFLLLLVPTALAAYRRSRPVLTGALALATLFLWFIFAGGRIPAHLFVLPLAMAALHPTGDARGRGFRFVGTLGAAFITLVIGSLHGSGYRDFVEYFLRDDLWFAVPTLALALWACVRARQRQDTHAGWLGLTAVLTISICILGGFLGEHIQKRDLLWVVLAAMANVTTLLLAVVLIRQGLAEKRLRPYGYGAFVFLAWLTWRYVDIEKDLGYLGMAGIFACIGAILFTLAMIWRQPREAEVAEAMDDFRPAWLESALAKLAPHRRSLLAGALALQFGVLGWMIYDHQRPISSGERFLLRCEPVDPRSLTKGDYVVLSYGFQQLTGGQKDRLMREWLDANAKTHSESKTSFEYAMPKDTIIYIPLEKDPEGLARFGEPSLRQPTSGHFLLTRKGKSSWTWQAIDVRAGIESYYVAEGTGHKWEQLRNSGQLLAEVGVLPNGKAGLIGLKPTDRPTLRTVRHSTLDRFFVTLKDAVPVTKAIRNKQEFEAVFHPAPLNGLSAYTPNFSNEIVLLHTLPETDVDTTITFQEVGLKDGVLIAKVAIKRGGKQTYTIRPQAAIVVPARGVTSVEITDETGTTKLLDAKLR
jgi:uncharacterized membrane protein/uncharacterized membrane-anchored protein